MCDSAHKHDDAGASCCSLGHSGLPGTLRIRSCQAKEPSKRCVATECQDGVLDAPCSPELRPAVDVIEGVVICPAEGRLSCDHDLVETDGVEVHIHIHALPDQVVNHLQKGIVNFRL